MPAVRGDIGDIVLIGCKSADVSVFIRICRDPGIDCLAILIRFVEVVGYTLLSIPDLEVNTETCVVLAVSGKRCGGGISIRKALLNLARYGSAQDVKQVAALIDALRATNPDFYDGDDPA